MAFEPTKVRESYRKKVLSYEAKYNCGYYTHIHTGLYEAATFPFVARAGVEQLQKLGESKIRHYLHFGQELLLNKLLSGVFLETLPRNILDCGAGHGGTALYIADNYSIHVVALTISDAQAAIIEKRVIDSRNDQLISVKCDNVFDADFGACFTHIVGIDAFCQMGDPATLFRKLSSFLMSNGLVVVSDYFARRKDSDITAYFDSYWSSNITTIEETIASAWQAGLILHRLSDVTEQQLPFWSLSIAHSNIILQQTEDEMEKRRLEGPRSFHSVMKSAFRAGDLTYKQIIFRKL